MAFFQDLGKKISEGMQDASEKASEMVEVNKLNSTISKEKNMIDDAKKRIGEKIFNMYKNGETYPEGFSDELQNIDTHLKNIAEVETKISQIKAGLKD